MVRNILLTAILLIPSFISTKAASGTTDEKVNYIAAKYEVQKDTYCNNWFISVGAGEQLLANENEKVLDISERIVPAQNVTVNKWLSSGTGIRAMYSGLSLKGIFYKENLCPQQTYGNQETPFSEQMNLHADILFRSSNLVFGYNEQRIWNVIPYANYALPNTIVTTLKDDYDKGMHSQNSSSVNHAVNINLNIHGLFVGNHFNKKNNKNKDGVFSATLGLTYSKPNQKKEKVQIPIYYDDLWEKYNKQLKDTLQDEEHLTILNADFVD